ncbi:hypothetical protein OUZ56_005146 [Daphnia magna]|uniref:Uncharacterized protein n=1 Tax=Daphnia magna TaxID=35525 RepID=A0ABQ9YRY6_9CRUS|nr:hypothetical protein OUZ56_005146 [Daphnia magna]
MKREEQREVMMSICADFGVDRGADQYPPIPLLPSNSLPLYPASDHRWIGAAASASSNSGQRPAEKKDANKN